MSTVDELLAFGERARTALQQRIDWVASITKKDDETEQFVLSWLLALSVAAWDVADSIFSLARNGNHVRAIAILTRVLYEYGIRVEYYAYFPDDAATHGANVANFLANIVQANRTRYDLSSMTEDQRRSFEALLVADSKVIRPNFYDMVEAVYRNRGHGPDELSSIMASQYRDFYAVTSALVHGSQGIYLDVFYKDDNQQVQIRQKALEKDIEVVLRNAIGFLIRVMYALTKHFGEFFSVRHLQEEFLGRFGQPS